MHRQLRNCEAQILALRCRTLTLPRPGKVCAQGQSRARQTAIAASGTLNHVVALQVGAAQQIRLLISRAVYTNVPHLH